MNAASVFPTGSHAVSLVNSFEAHIIRIGGMRRAASRAFRALVLNGADAGAESPRVRIDVFALSGRIRAFVFLSLRF